MKPRFYIKRGIRTIVISLIILSMSVPVFAESTDVQVKIQHPYGQVRVQFDDVLGHPFINDDGRTLVPFRAVANFMGIDVDWDNTAREARFYRYGYPVEIDGNASTFDYILRFPLDTNEVWETFNLSNDAGTVTASHDRLSYMDTNSVIYNSRTYAPIRYLAEAFQYTVGWDNDTRTVLLTPPEGDWASQMIASEAQRGTPVLKNKRDAQLYVLEYIRNAYGGGMASVEYLQDTVSFFLQREEETGWLFQIFPEVGDALYVYINEGGETWFQNTDNGQYLLWHKYTIHR